VIDGEVIVQDAEGRSDFTAVQDAIRWRPGRLLFFAFDLLFLNGEDLRDAPLLERRELLRIVIFQTFEGKERSRARIQFSDSVTGGGPAFFTAAEKMGLEGIVSKRCDSRYRGGRTDRWRKIKCWMRSELIVVGTAVDSKSGSPLALLAEDAADGLHFAGGAFITLRGRARERFGEKLAKLATDRPPIPGLHRRPGQWVKPELVVGVRHLRGTGVLRHATVTSVED
jgi:ATP-dependent DNA ligase